MLIEKWGRSSAASTAVSVVDAIKSLMTPTIEGDWFSSGVSSSVFDMQKGLFLCSTNGAEDAFIKLDFGDSLLYLPNSSLLTNPG